MIICNFALKKAYNPKPGDEGKTVSFRAPNWNVELPCRPLIKVVQKLYAFWILQNAYNPKSTYGGGEYFATLFRAPV